MTEQTFHQKVARIISALNSPKDVENKFAGFDYRTAEGILKAAKVTMKELEIEDIIILTTKEVVFIEGRHYQKAIARITDGKDSYSAEGLAMEPESKPKMDVSQVSGSAATYARKYALQDLLMISDEIDPDSMNNSGNDQSKKSNKPSGLSESQKKTVTEKFTNFANAQGMTIQEATKKLFPYLKIQSTLPNLTPDDFGVLMNYLNQHQ